MKKKYAGILLALIGVLGLSTAVQANNRAAATVTLPFEFVANGKTLPAGTYTITTLSDDPTEGLILSSYENHVSVVVHPIETEKAIPEKTNAEKSSVSFQRVGEQRFLDRIQTTDTVYNLPVPRAATLMAAKPSPESSPVSGTSGSN